MLRARVVGCDVRLLCWVLVECIGMRDDCGCLYMPVVVYGVWCVYW